MRLLTTRQEQTRTDKGEGEVEVEVIAVRMASQTNLILGLTGARAIDAHRDKHVETRERTGSPGIAQVSASIFLMCTG